MRSYSLIDDTEVIFNKFGMDSKVYPSNMDEANQIRKKVALTGARLMLIKQKHLGSDKLPTYIENFTEFLKEKGVKVLENAEVIDIISNGKDNH